MSLFGDSILLIFFARSVSILCIRAPLLFNVLMAYNELVMILLITNICAIER
jgi:hypothetical protein